MVKRNFHYGNEEKTYARTHVRFLFLIFGIFINDVQSCDDVTY